MKIIPIKCPSCGASLELQDNRKDYFCQYCGEHIYLDDENRVITNVQIVRDEALIKEAEIKARKLEFEIAKQKELKIAEEKKAKRKLVSIVLIIIGLFLEFIPYFCSDSLGIPANVAKVLMVIALVVITGGIFLFQFDDNKNQKKK